MKGFISVVPQTSGVSQMRILHEVPAKILKQLRKSEARPGKQLDSSQLAKEVDTTYAHLTKVIVKMEDEGLVTRKQQGRSKYIELTEQGEEVAQKVSELSEALRPQHGVTA